MRHFHVVSRLLASASAFVPISALIAILGLSIHVPSSVQAQEIAIFKIMLKDGVVSPNKVEVPKDARVKLIVSNEGSAPAEFESKALHIEKIMAPGMTVTVNLRGLKPGSYGFVDEYRENQKTAHGVIVVK